MGKKRRLSVTLTDSDYYFVRAYVREKRRWVDPAALLRDALFQHIARNPLSAAQEQRVEEEQGEGTKDGPAVLREATGGRK